MQTGPNKALIKYDDLHDIYFLLECLGGHIHTIEELINVGSANGHEMHTIIVGANADIIS
mgnify:CR=1 FL=1